MSIIFLFQFRCSNLNRIIRIASAAFLILGSILFLPEAPSATTKGVQLTPTRVVFADRNRTAVVRLINTNQTPCTYRISLVSLRMDDTGNRTEVDTPTPEELAVQKMIRFSPRRSTVKPNQWQTVRLMLRKPAHLAPGEYRTHLKVEPLPDPRDPKTQNHQSQGVSIHIDYYVAITIPVIIRHGKGKVNVIPVKTALKQSEKTGDYYLETELMRQGLFSAYGNVNVFHTPHNSQKPIKAGELKGLSFYTPNTRQIRKIPLSIKNPLSLYEGTIGIEFVDIEQPAHPVIGVGSFQLRKP